MTTQPFITCDNLVKIYKVADLEVVALQGLELEVNRGEMLALVGASGSGKTTLLNILGGLDTPSAGSVSVAGMDLLELNDARRVSYKQDLVGFVWQQPTRNLLPYLTALENVKAPMMLSGRAGEAEQRATQLLEIVDLTDRAYLYPDQLSGGQQQRVALAVALANNPPLLLADEPTGQLDTDLAHRIFDYLRQLNQRFNTTIIVVTHDPSVAARVDRVIAIIDGKTSTEIRRQRNRAGETIHEEEWVLLDRAGRMQIPQVYVDTLSMTGRVKVRLESGHLSVWPGGLPGVSVSAVPAVSKTLPGPAPDAIMPAPMAHNNGEPVVVTRQLSRVFTTEVETIHAVDDVSLTIPPGVLALVKGRSGSGKTTLLNLIGGLDTPTSGAVDVVGQPISAMSESERITLRRDHIGFIFQTFGLLPFLSALENVETALRLVRTERRQRHDRALEVLRLVGLQSRANHRVHELSGGEQQRVAIARALANHPRLILADEPTGQLDTDTGTHIITMLRQIVSDAGITVIIASHDPKVEEAADLIIQLQDGKIAEVTPPVLVS
jgi:peptide/nickel transport system ATP-binding protein